MGSLFKRGEPRTQTVSKSTRYLFVDGVFFERVISQFLKDLDFMEEDAVDYSKLAESFDRVIYYDALPVKKKNQTAEDYAEKFKFKRDFLNRIREQQLFHVRDGYTRNRPKENSRIEQKGVDTWIAVDALKYALSGVIDEAVVITSDLDLYPLFEALVETKTKGCLLFDKKRTSKELIQSADISEAITHEHITGWLETSLANKIKVFKSRFSTSKPNDIVLEFAPIKIRFRYEKPNYHAVIVGQTFHYQCENLASLIYFLEEKYLIKIDTEKLTF